MIELGDINVDGIPLQHDGEGFVWKSIEIRFKAPIPGLLNCHTKRILKILKDDYDLDDALFSF